MELRPKKVFAGVSPRDPYFATRAAFLFKPQST